MLFKFSGVFVLSFILLNVIYTVFYIGFVSEKNDNKLDFMDYFIKVTTAKSLIATLILALGSSYISLSMMSLD